MIDVHTHIFNEKVYREYRKRCGKRVTRALVLQWFEHDTKRLLDFVSSKKDLAMVATVDMEKNIPSQLKRLGRLFKVKKIVGIKLYPGYQRFFPSDKKVHPIAALCQKYDKPLIFHTGDVLDVRGPRGRALLKYSHPIHIDELASSFPGCRIVIAHFGFPYHVEAANVVSKNKNVYTEISGTVDEVGDKEEMRHLLNQYANDLARAFAYYPDVKEKTMFGTDFSGEHSPLNQFEPYVALVKKLFTAKEQKMVFEETAKKVFFS